MYTVPAWTAAGTNLTVELEVAAGCFGGKLKEQVTSCELNHRKVLFQRNNISGCTPCQPAWQAFPKHPSGCQTDSTTPATFSHGTQNEDNSPEISHTSH